MVNEGQKKLYYIAHFRVLKFFFLSRFAIAGHKPSFSNDVTAKRFRANPEAFCIVTEKLKRAGNGIKKRKRKRKVKTMAHTDKARERHVKEMERLQQAIKKTTSTHLIRDYVKALKRMARDLEEYDRYKAKVKGMQR